MGKEATLKDVLLELTDIEIDLQCHEKLDDEPEEAEVGLLEEPYKIVTVCYQCNRDIRLCVVASTPGIRGLQELLFGSVTLVCPLCAKHLSKDVERQ